MVLLFCVAVGAVGDAFSVEINEAKKVYYLSEAIRTAKANELKDVDACQLELYLAKKDKGHGAWLTKKEAADVRYESVPQEFKPMRTTRYLNASEYLGEDFQPGEGHVHVLALYPTNLHIRMNDQYPEVISSYMEVADRLKETEEVKALSSHLANISVKNDAFTPFVVLENSSGTGKTQMAFNLQVRGECEVFYIVCGTFGLGAQRVYRPYEKRSKAFQYCLEKDLKAMEAKKFGNGEPIGSVGDFRRSTTLALYSFILAALRGRDVVIGTASRSDVYAEVARRKERGAKPFVFFLDEFPRARHIKSCFDNDDKVKSGEYQRELENELRMTRNVFLSLGLTVVACSTNGSGKNLFVTGSHSRGGEPSLWCVVFPSLPRVNITIDSEIPVLLKEIIKHSRPLFAEIALKHVQDHPCGDNSDICSYLDEMAGALASGFRMLKRTGSEFKIGQLCLLLCSSCHVQDIKVDIIDRHYARLPEQSAFKLYLSGNGLIKDDDFWTCRAVPPSPSEDLLLHLTIMGGGAILPSV
ncbi:hypothetical protein DVH05_017446 [Phytophthora capsici]|nr:hypothetical protein DVH05_017446 [Phytophthora capsici]